jgi:hypothetical protein
MHIGLGHWVALSTRKLIIDQIGDLPCRTLFEAEVLRAGELDDAAVALAELAERLLDHASLDHLLRGIGDIAGLSPDPPIALVLLGKGPRLDSALARGVKIRGATLRDAAQPRAELGDLGARTRSPSIRART